MSRELSFVVALSILAASTATYFSTPALASQPSISISQATNPVVVKYIETPIEVAEVYTQYVTEDEVARVAAEAGLPVSDALFVARCESGVDLDYDGVKEHFDTLAEGRYLERGIWQIHPMHKKLISSIGYTWDDMYSPRPNAVVAKVIFDLLGWYVWSCHG